MTPFEQAEISKLRRHLYALGPAIGNRADNILRQALPGVTTMGNATVPAPATTLSDLLRMLSNGFATAASTSTASVNAYYDAQTAIAQAQAANAAGVPVAQYTAAATLRNQAADLINPGTALGSTVLGVPIWLLIGGAALVLVMRK